MPIEFEIRGRRIEVVTRGVFSQDETKLALERIFSDPGFVPGSRVLIDARSVDEVPTSDEISERAAWLASGSQQLISHCAVVVSGKLQYGLGRMFSAFAEPLGFDVQVFETREQAEHWLSEP